MNDLAVLIPVYGNQAGLERSLCSLRQARGGFDVVVVDDGSAQPIRTPLRLRDDVPVSLLRLEANQGIAGALNRGLVHVLDRHYTHVGRLDAGDTVVPERFERQLRFLESNPACVAVSSRVDFVDSRQKTLFRYRAPSEHAEILNRLRLNNCLVHAATMIRVSALRELGTYREDVAGGEDYELFLRFARRYKLAVLPEVLTRVEYEPRGLSVAGRRQQQRTRLRLQLSHFDASSAYSYYGVARTLVAMLIPQFVVVRVKIRLSR